VRFKAFDNRHLLAAAAIVDGVVVWPADSGIDAGGIPKSLGCAADQASDNCCPFSYLKNKLQINFDQWLDPSHMNNNASWNGCTKAGYACTIRIMVSFQNIRYGPRNTGGFFKVLSDSAVDMSVNLAPKDPLVSMMWPKICDDKRHRAPSDVSPQACQQWLNELPQSRAASVKGPQSGLQGFYAYKRCGDYWDESHHETITIGVFASLCHNWARKWNDIFTVSPSDVTIMMNHLEDLAKKANSEAALVDAPAPEPLDPFEGLDPRAFDPFADVPDVAPGASSSSSSSGSAALPPAASSSGASSSSSSGGNEREMGAQSISLF
jgi:hypothetical protein